MYGTVAKLKVKPGQLEGLKKQMSARTSGNSAGFVSATVYQLDANPNELYLAVLFDSKEAYVANANRPETNADFQQMMQFLAAEPEWHDGQVISSM